MMSPIGIGRPSAAPSPADAATGPRPIARWSRRASEKLLTDRSCAVTELKETGVPADIPDMPPLYALEPGDRATVAVPGSTDPEVVAFLDTLGLRPGVTVEVREKHPFDGPLVLRVGGKDRTLGSSVANQVFVTPI